MAKKFYAVKVGKSLEYMKHGQSVKARLVDFLERYIGDFLHRKKLWYF